VVTENVVTNIKKTFYVECKVEKILKFANEMGFNESETRRFFNIFNFK
jgi:hypothetical protein